MCLNFMEAPEMWKAACRHCADTETLLAVLRCPGKERSGDASLPPCNAARHH
jgi:hypothetical protein